MLLRTHLSPHTTRYLDRFSRFCTAHGTESLYFTLGRPFPSQNSPFAGGVSGLHLIGLHGSLGPPEAHNSNGISIGSAVFAGFTIVTDRPTHGQTDHVVLRL